MVLTKVQKQVVVKHIIENIFGEDLNSELHKAFMLNSITSSINLIGQSDAWIYSYNT